MEKSVVTEIIDDVQLSDFIQKNKIGTKVIDGKEVPVVKVETENIVHADGRKDVIIKVPVIKTRNKIKGI